MKKYFVFIVLLAIVGTMIYNNVMSVAEPAQNSFDRILEIQ